MKIISFNFHIGDFLGGVTHMTTEEIGAYTLLIIAHYQYGELGLPKDQKRLAIIAKTTPSKWKKISVAVLAMFEETDTNFVQKRVVFELKNISDRSNDQRSKALKRWNSSDAVAMPWQCRGNANHKPLTINHKPIEEDKKDKPPIPPLPDWLSKTDWDDFISMRKKIKKPLTGRAMELVLKKLDKFRQAGHDPTAVLQNSIINCWQDVYEPRGNRNEINGRSNQKYSNGATKPNQDNLAEQTFSHPGLELLRRNWAKDKPSGGRKN